MPAFLAPWIDRFYTPSEMRLIAALDGRVRPWSETEAIAADLEKRPDETSRNAFLDRCIRRGIIAGNRGTGLEAADFHCRFEYWALFEGWMDLPKQIRQRLNTWELDDYVARHARTAASVGKSGFRRPDQACPEYLLLHEAEALLERVARIYLWPCNCRAMMDGCTHSRFTCLRFDNDRGIGWEISVERAKAIVRQANREGLMQSGEVSLDQGGRIGGALCNCCSDCCFPHQLAVRMGVEKKWPHSRYTAAVDADQCTGCGRCTRRCPFGAVSLGDGPENRRHGETASIDSKQCRGCGLCATGCPSSAIEMQPVGFSILENLYRTA
jgi:ferredoxin